MVRSTNPDFYKEDYQLPYKSKKKKKPTTAKANHKHEYSEKVIVKMVYNHGNSHWYEEGSRCAICGRIRPEKMLWQSSVYSKRYKTDEDVRADFPGIPIITENI